MLLPLLLPGVEFVEAVSDNGNGESDDQDTEYRTEATENLSKSCDRRHVPIANRGHCNDGPPVGVEHRVEGCLLLLLLKHEDEGGEHDGSHAQQQEEQPQLLVVGPHGVAKGLEAGGMFG